MIAQLSAVLTGAEQQLLAAFMVFLRIGAILALLPAFGEETVPMRIRLGAAVALSALVYPLVEAGGAFAGRAGGFTLAEMAAEVVAGLAIGAFFRALVWALQIAGTIAGQATSLAQLFGGTGAVDQMPAFGNALVLGALALAMTAGYHVRLVIALAGTYEALPPGRFPAPDALAALGVDALANAFYTGFGFAAPFVVASVIYNVALGAINRAMPQLMVAFVGAPVITLGGLALMAVTAPLILSAWLDLLDAVLADPFEVPR